MSEATTNINITPGLQEAPSAARQSSFQSALSRPESARSVSSSDSFVSRGLEDQDLNVLARFLASKLRVSEFAAFSMVRKFVGTGQSASFADLKNFFRDFSSSGKAEQLNQEFKSTLQQLQNPALQNKPNQELEKLFKPIVQKLQEQFAEFRETSSRDNLQKFSKQQFQAVNFTRPQLTQLVTSPKAFASWLVNNRAAFLTLKSNPQLAQLLMALQNPNLQKSPVLLQEIYKMITQVIKLKRGRSQIEDFDDEVKENLDAAATQEVIDHEANIVHSLRQVVEQTPAGPLRDFLLEAERFAEEEIANMWSLALKKMRKKQE